MPNFNSSRLVLARERRSLFAKELAERCGVTAQTVSNWEAGSTEPSAETVSHLSKVLDFPEAFFFKIGPDRLPEGAPNFRSRSKIPARQKKAALAAGDLVRELADWIETRFELPPVNLPNLRGQEPSLAAQVIRTEWLIGDKPIPNMIHLLESRGVLVFSLAQDCKEIDAFSFWSNGRPIVLLNTMKSAERSRMDAAHELFHLIAHTEETGKQEEEDADAFAGALLMPQNDLLRYIPRVVGLNQCLQWKQRWGVSLSALIYRLHKVGIATDWQYRSLFMNLSKLGYRTTEPTPMPRENSGLLPQIFSSLKGQGITMRQVAGELCWSPEQLHEFLLGLGATLIGLDGGSAGTGSGKKDRLRLV